MRKVFENEYWTVTAEFVNLKDNDKQILITAESKHVRLEMTIDKTQLNERIDNHYPIPKYILNELMNTIEKINDPDKFKEEQGLY